MADTNELLLKVNADVENAKKQFDTLTKTIEDNQKVFDRFKSFKDPLGGIRLTSERATVSLKGLTNELKKSTNPLEVLSNKLKAFEKERDKLLGARNRKLLTGDTDTTKEDSKLSALVANYQKYVQFINQSAYLKQYMTGLDNKLIELQSDLNSKLQEQSFLQQQVQKDQEEQNRLLSEQAKSQEELRQQTAQFESEFASKMSSAQEALEKFKLSLDPAKQKMAELQARMKEQEDVYVNLKINDDNADTTQVERNIKKIQKEMQRLQNSTKKTSSQWQVLLGRMKNIAIYRSIRTAFHWLTSGIREGVDNLVQFDDSANSTMSNLNASVTQIKNTMGVAFMSVLQALEPVITTLSDGLVNLINSFNLAMAKMQGENVYTKAKKNVDDYAASLKKAQKFSFDTFEVLSGGEAGKTPAIQMFEEGNVEEDGNRLSRVFEKVLAIIRDIGRLVGDIIGQFTQTGVLEVIVETFGVLLSVVGGIVRGIADFISALNQVGLLKPMLLAIAAAFIAIKVAAIGAAIASAAKTIFSNPWAGIPAVLAGAGILATLGGKLLASTNVQGFADGGFTTANFIATNENGKREWVGRNAGATAVVNDTQMSDIMYQAVRQGCYEGMMQANYENVGAAGDSTITLQVDNNVLGRVVASSTGFKAEATRIGLI